MKCEICGEDTDNNSFFVAVDTPVYMNIWFHRGCIHTYQEAYNYVSKNISALCEKYKQDSLVITKNRKQVKRK
jgi:hypothetical protein